MPAIFFDIRRYLRVLLSSRHCSTVMLQTPGIPDVPLVTLVSYCSRERVFADAVVANARKFSDLVVVSLGTRLYTGEPEDVQAETARLVAGQDDGGLCPVMVAVYNVHETLLSTPVALHNMAREIGVQTARQALGGTRAFWVLMLDGDEVPDGDRFKAWWTATKAEGGSGSAVRADPRAVHKMANHWLFLHPRLVADVLEDSVLLVHSDTLLSRDALSHPRERDGIYLWHLSSPLGFRDLRVERRVLGLDGKPLFWHFSWVRPGVDGDRGRAALKAKCANWGHRDDCDWAALIDSAFDAMAQGTWPTHDFVHGYPLRLLDALPVEGLEGLEGRA